MLETYAGSTSPGVRWDRRGRLWVKEFHCRCQDLPSRTCFSNLKNGFSLTCVVWRDSQRQMQQESASLAFEVFFWAFSINLFPISLPSPTLPPTHNTSRLLLNGSSISLSLRDRGDVECIPLG